MVAQSASRPVTLNEILGQPVAWSQAVDGVLAQVEHIRSRLLSDRPDICLFTGCGTSYYLSIAAAGFFQELTGIPSRPVPASELILSRSTHLAPGQQALLFAFSRSGETSETIVAVRRFREAGLGAVVAVTCREQCTMGLLGDHHLAIPAAADTSVVMTSSFTSMLLASALLAAIIGGHEELRHELASLAERVGPALEQQRLLGETLGSDLRFERFVFLGTGPFSGLALEAMLKMKEMTQVPSEAYSSLEFRHGPISVVDEGTMVVMVGSERAARQEQDVLRDVRVLGGHTFLLATPASTEPAVWDYAYTPPGLKSEIARAIAVMPFLQLLAYYRATTLGLNPDQPQHLNQVVALDESSLEGGWP